MNDPERVLVRPQGRIDALGARELWSELEPVTSRAGVKLIVDLSDTRYTSSEGIRVLLRAGRAAREHGGHLYLCCLSPRLREILAMAGLENLFDIYPTRAAAEQAASASAD